MTAPVPVPDGTTPPAEAVEAADDAAYLHQPSRREVSRGEYAWSCRCGALLGDASALVRHVAFETAAAVVATLDLPERDREAGAKALDEAAQKWTWGKWSDVMLPASKPPAIPALDYGQRVGDWIRSCAAALREGPQP